MKKIILVIIAFVSFSAFAQDSNVEELQARVDNAKSMDNVFSVTATVALATVNAPAAAVFAAVKLISVMMDEPVKKPTAEQLRSQSIAYTGSAAGLGCLTAAVASGGVLAVACPLVGIGGAYVEQRATRRFIVETDEVAALYVGPQ